MQQADPPPYRLPAPSSWPIWTSTDARRILNPAVSIGTGASAPRLPTPLRPAGAERCPSACGGGNQAQLSPMPLHPRPRLTHTPNLFTFSYVFTLAPGDPNKQALVHTCVSMAAHVCTHTHTHTHTGTLEPVSFHTHTDMHQWSQAFTPALQHPHTHTHKQTQMGEHAHTHT